ncbi:2-keto-4-pentenoate hydratase/2-oxohepta-3-ene-1,7-dioic acid hydratase (catechol pathway) [Rhodoferax sp. OV413]|uniref:fumarylacetoacetate hydrolase family protein n=1 Tax=Rhodoferax sp. OV413 TaxID=1855285 RepID=UPI00087E48ED|nr:fumarylacetoacetate hydrolase family protein [Rhodoferax sp. OV413]SDP45916.1 2-keto-4-pentenoate hydratase/2-oxohepta-3-ene-1,7-dioic acid hydratase (catechol pathway) [Rhodoferax sp. OV413]
MKLLSFEHGGRASWGVVQGHHVADLGRAYPQYPTLQSYIAAGRLSAVAQDAASVLADIPLDAIRYLPVIPQPEKIVCAIRNYHDHHREVVAAGLDRELSAFPPIFLRVWRSQVAHGQPILRPHVSQSLDWEGELAVVIGKEGRNIPAAQAHEYIAGYSVYNDASIREWQFHAKAICAGKNFEATGAFGPWLVTTDEIAPDRALKLTTRLNGELVQSTTTADMIFSVAQQIEYASTIFTLVPGDVIVTGTPGGVGWSKKPPRFMVPGDVVEVEIEGIGVLRNPIAQAA